MGVILLGPLLGLEGQDARTEHDHYTVCFLSDPSTNDPVLITDSGQKISFIQITDTPGGRFWRAELEIDSKIQSGRFGYRVVCGDEPLSAHGHTQWSFHVPAPDESPCFAFASCNGYGYAEIAQKAADPFALWKKMAETHEKRPFSALLMGGDQLYADEVWSTGLAPKINTWPLLSQAERDTYVTGSEYEQKADRFYEQLYIEKWGEPEIAHMLASIPTVMIWDDHDIFDGWGSFPAELLENPLYRTLFDYAKKYFRLFQIRSMHNKSLIEPSPEKGPGHHDSLGFRFRDYHLIALDQRTNRSLDQTMSKKQWVDIQGWLDQLESVENIVFVVSVPLIYRSFAFVEWLCEKTKKIEELEDDIHDHWSAKRHRDEREALVSVFLDTVARARGKAFILSGDIHLGGLAMLRDHNRDLELLQVISSGIVNFPPTWLQWRLIRLVTSDDRLYFGKGKITAKIIRPKGGGEYLRTRNFATFQKTENGEIEFQWECEDDTEPYYLF